MHLYRAGEFMGSAASVRNRGFVLFGAPMDVTSSFGRGSSGGPQGIRQVSQALEEYSPTLDRELADTGFYDAGDLQFAPGQRSAPLADIGRMVQEILAQGCRPFMLGGEHLVTWPAIREVYGQHKDLVVLHFDAHADLRQDYLGEALSHATVMRRVLDFLPGSQLYQFGIRSGEREEFAFARKNVNFFPNQVLTPLFQLLPELGDVPIYISLDIDVVDPAYAPGTGTPEAGGISSSEILQVIALLKEKNVVGMDLVEFSPISDHGNVTAVLGAKLVRESLLAFSPES